MKVKLFEHLASKDTNSNVVCRARQMSRAEKRKAARRKLTDLIHRRFDIAMAIQRLEKQEEEWIASDYDQWHSLKASFEALNIYINNLRPETR